MFHALTNAVHNRDGVAAAALLENRQIDRAFAVHADNVVLQLSAILRMSNIAYQHGGISHSFQRNGIDIRRLRHLAVRVDVVVFGADANITRRQNQVGVVDRFVHVVDAEAVGFQLHRDRRTPSPGDRFRHRAAVPMRL